MVFGASAAAVSLSTGCGHINDWMSGPLPPSGDLLTPNREIGHRLREPRESRIKTKPGSDSGEIVRRSCVIVGGGVSGLTAAWHLKSGGIDDFAVLELETMVGGTSRSGQSGGEGGTGGFRYPWGAHYLPAPQASNAELVAFLKSCGVIESTVESTDGAEITYAEQYLCREPEERVFADEQWWPGLVPDDNLTPADREQIAIFEGLMKDWTGRTGNDGKPFFSLPIARCSRDPEAIELDRHSFADWMNENALDSPVVRWMAQYACQDDYGLNTDETSAWAGIFYFVARMIGDSGQTQPVLTWPEGNGFLVDRLHERVADQTRTGQAVMSIDRLDDGGYQLLVIDTSTMAETTIIAEHVILAVPEFVRRNLIQSATSDSAGQATGQATGRATGRAAGQVTESVDAFQYGSWLVANVHLTGRPSESGFPMAWDNVSRTSSSLGYVNSVHQTGRDHGETVLTWYTALPNDVPAKVRSALMTLTWAEASETVIGDLEKMHPKIRSLISRIDVMVWGHAMVQPRVGTIFHPDRIAATSIDDNLHLASTDLSGIALFEEAFDHGRRAAMKVIASLAR